MGFDELVKINVEDSSPLAGDHSSGNHQRSAGPRNAEIVEGGTSGRLGEEEKVLGIE